MIPLKNIVRDKRLELGLTMKEVADAVGVSEGTVSRWESGDIADMKRSRIINLAKVLKISPLEILDLPAEKEQPAPKSELSEDEAMLLDLFRSLPEDERKSVLLLLRRAAGRS